MSISWRTPRLAPGIASLGLLCALLWAGTGVAWAHARLIRGDPAPELVLPSSPLAVHLWFDEDLNGASSQIIVWDRYRHVENQGKASLVPGQPRQMVVPLKTLTAGSYLVLWTSVSAEDGHVLRGSYLFSVIKPGPGPSLAGVSLGGPSQTFPDAQGLASIITHWIELLAATVWIGAAGFSVFVFAASGRKLESAARLAEKSRLRFWLRVSILALILSSAVVLALQAYAVAGNDWGAAFSGTTLSGVFSAQYGKLWIGRQSLAVVALLATFLAGVHPWRRFPFRLRESGSLDLGRIRFSILRGLVIRRSAGVGTVPPVSVLLDLRRDAVETAVPSRGRTETELQSLHDVSGEQGRAAWLTGVLVLGFLYLYFLAASGHAASSHIGDLGGIAIISASVFVDWLHLVGNSLWFGGQIYIVLVLIPALLLRQDPRSNVGVFLATLNRFSPIAYASIAFFSLSGGFNGKIHISTWYAFFHSVYGWTLVFKTGLVGLMMLVSAYTVYRLRPRIRRSLASTDSSSSQAPPLTRSLLSWLRVNPVLGCGVLLATSVLYSYPVPPGLAPPGPSSYTVHQDDLTAIVSITPDHSGPNQVTVLLRDKHGRPVQQANASILTTMLDMVMGTGLAPLHETAPGRFTGPAELGMGGNWRFQLLVYRPPGILTRLNVDVQVGT